MTPSVAVSNTYCTSKRCVTQPYRLEGLKRASTVRAGMHVGSENAQDQEPFVISEALGSEQIWTGPNGKSWNGVIKAGDKYVRVQKLHRESALVYLQTDDDHVFFLNCEDVRIADMKCSITEERRRRTRSSNDTSVAKRYEFGELEIDTLKKRTRVCTCPSCMTSSIQFVGTIC